MASLTGNSISSTYKAVLKTADNDIVDGTLKTVEDGLGNSSALQVSTTAVKSTGSLEATGNVTGANLSGSNTGDETTSTIKTKLGAASTSADGYLTSTDWNIFNGKQSALSGTGYLRFSGSTPSYVNGTSSQLTAADGTLISAGTNITISGGTISASGGGGGGISGLTTNKITKATSSTTIGDSQVFDNGTFVGVNTTTDNSSGAKLQVNGGTTSTWTQLSAGTASKSPLKFTPTGAVLETSPTAGDVEVDANGFAYGYTADGTAYRGLIPMEQFLIQDVSRSLTSTTSLQALFGGLAGSSLTVKGFTTYFFECMFSLSGMSNTTGNCGFNIIGGGTATFVSSNFYTNGIDASTLSSASGSGGIFVTGSSVTSNILQSNIGTGMVVIIKGVIRTNAGGTIIPSINLTTASAATLAANSYFRLIPIGDGSVITPGYSAA